MRLPAVENVQVNPLAVIVVLVLAGPITVLVTTLADVVMLPVVVITTFELLAKYAATLALL